MSGLVLKDLLVLRKQGRSYLLIIGIYMVLAFAGVFDYSILSTMMVVLTMMLPMATFSYDELARWDKFAAAMPVGRSGIIKAKYLMALAVIGGAGLLCFVVNIIVAMIDHEAQLGALMASLGGSLGAGLLINAAILPLLFKYGAEKSRSMMMVVMLAVFILVFGLITIAGEGGFALTNAMTAVIPWLAALLVLGGFVVSYRISQKLYAQKEL